MTSTMLTIVLLTISNVFMTVAWYGHLKYPQATLWMAILVAWGIALFEYCFQVPANRIGNQAGITLPQLKIMQEVITLVVFCVFASTCMGYKITWNYYAGFAFVLVGVFFVYHKW